MKISFYFTPSELRAMNTVKEIFGIKGINYDAIPMDDIKFIGNMTSGKIFSGCINDNITSGVLYTIAKYDREIKAVVKAVKACTESIACLITSGMIDEIADVMRRNRKPNFNFNFKKNHKH